MIANWNAVLAFVCIIFAVCGALKNRRTKLIKVEQSKSFVVGGIVSTVIVGVGLSFIVVKVFGDLIMLIGYYKG
jgi:energy-converting hydrogenase Eha subunit A